MSNLEIVQNAYEAFGRGDIESVLEALDPDVEWVESEVLPFGGSYHGPQAVAEEVFARMPGAWDKFELVPEEWIDGGDTVVMIGRTTLGKDGREETSRTAQVWKLRDGAVVRYESFQDTLSTARVLATA
jgi:ketosteroid isomerase-like protein